MKFRYASDIHLHSNRGEFDIPPGSFDDSDVLILAGDVCDFAVAGTDKIVELCDMFEHVLYVFGNHEYYDTSFKDAEEKCRKHLKFIPNNLTFMNQNFKTFGNITVIGATLWTDLGKYNPADSELIRRILSDFDCIFRNHDRRFITPDDWYDEHIKHLDYFNIQYKLARDRGDQVVIVSHHAPTHLSIHERYRGNASNIGYYSDLSDFILDREIKFWVHGHTHDPVDYMIGDTNVLCNPKGYRKEAFRSKFNPLAAFEVI